MKKTNKDIVMNLSNKELDKIDLSHFDKYLPPDLKSPSGYNFYGNTQV